MIADSELKSIQVLDDCERSLALLEQVPEGDRQLFRIYWTFCLVTLKRVDDVLKGVDGKRFPALGAAYKRRVGELLELKDRYKNLPYEQCDKDYLLYSRFIHDERNKAAHREGPADFGTWTVIGNDLNFNLGDVYLPFADIQKMGDYDCRDWIRDAIVWWRCEIEKMAASAVSADEE